MHRPASAPSFVNTRDVLDRIAEYWPSENSSRVCNAWRAANLRAALGAWRDPRFAETACWMTGEDPSEFSCLLDKDDEVCDPAISAGIARISGLLRRQLPPAVCTVGGERLLFSGSHVNALLHNEDRSLCILWDEFVAEETICLPKLPPPDRSVDSMRDRAQAIRACMSASGEALSSVTDMVCNEKGLSCLPKETQMFSRLERLELAGNELTALPESMARLPLAFLDVSGNRISALPKSLHRLTQLFCLNVAENPLRQLPNGIADIQGLAYLRVAATDIDALPESFRRMRRLRCLDISCNRFAALPEWLGEWGRDIERERSGSLLNFRLEVLAENNQICGVSEEMSHLFGDRLGLQGNPLSSPVRRTFLDEFANRIRRAIRRLLPFAYR